MELKKKDVMNDYTVVSIGYCDAQYLLGKTRKIGYTCGVYGWNSDIYILQDDKHIFAISTGYRPFENITTKNKYEIVKKYESRAKAIYSKYYYDFKKCNTALKRNLNNFINEIFINMVF